LAAATTVNKQNTHHTACRNTSHCMATDALAHKPADWRMEFPSVLASMAGSQSYTWQLSVVLSIGMFYTTSYTALAASTIVIILEAMGHSFGNNSSERIKQ